MATYAIRDAGGDVVILAPEYGKPVPAHAQTEGAARAVEAVRVAGRAKRSALADAEIVTDHGNPAYEPYDRDPVPPAARKLRALAEAHGMTTNVVELTDRCTVEAIDAVRGVAFRCYYVRGQVKGGTWHEAAFRYTLADDPRPVGVHKTAFVALAGKRAKGVGPIHLRILGSPIGVPCNVTEIERRIKEL